METYIIIEGFENYSVSVFGNVKNNKTGRQLKPGKNKLGYEHVILTANNKSSCLKRVHRLVACGFLENPNNKCFVDHIDNNPSNNAVINLRWATACENQQNKRMMSKNSSGVKGVFWEKSCNKWRAQITIDGIKIHIGLYINIEEAKQARMIRANQAFGIYTHSIEKII